MAQDTSLQGIRSQLLTSIFGRRLALDSADFLIGPKDIRYQIEGLSSAGSTITSTAVATSLSNWGVSLVGATLASATTAYNLTAPTPGVRKVLFNVTTGVAVILTSGANIVSTASVGSTLNQITFVGKGAMADLIGLTTALWGLLTPLAITSVTTGNLVQLV